MSDDVDRIRAQFERGLTRLYPVQFTSEAARTVENGEEVERMKSRVVDADAERAPPKNAFDFSDPPLTVRRDTPGDASMSETDGTVIAALHEMLDGARRERDEASAEIARLRERIDYENTTAAEETGLRISAPPEPAAMALAAGLCRQLELMYLGPEGDEVDPAAQEFLARAITEYGEQRAREARAALREQGYCMACGVYHRVGNCAAVENASREARAEYVEESRWLREACVAAARTDAWAAAFEKAANTYRYIIAQCGTPDPVEACRLIIATCKSALAVAPPQPEGGEG